MLEMSRSCDRVAGILNVSSERVLKLVEVSLSGQHFIHGIKNAASLEGILREGVLPKSPDGGVSFWTGGVRMFTASSPESSLFGLDSSFFDYGTKLLALTNGGLLAGAGIYLQGIRDFSLILINRFQEVQSRYWQPKVELVRAAHEKCLIFLKGY